MLNKDLQKDPRVQLIKNNERRGTLNNRCMGTFQAKGKYVIYLDGDLFITDDLFDRIYN